MSKLGVLFRKNDLNDKTTYSIDKGIIEVIVQEMLYD